MSGKDYNKVDWLEDNPIVAEIRELKGESNEWILKKIQEKREELGGNITHERALLLVAQDFKVIYKVF